MSDTLRDSVAAEAEKRLLSVVHTVYQHETYVDVAREPTTWTARATWGMSCSKWRPGTT